MIRFHPVRIGVFGVALLGAAWAAGAASAACTAPASGVTRIQGVVREAVAGDTVCIQTRADHGRLIRLRLLDVAAPPLRGPGGEGAKWALRRVARGRPVVCVVMGAGVGVCRIYGVAIGERLEAKARG
jgi:endonuclease YncB( thermonuclease family)